MAVVDQIAGMLDEEQRCKICSEALCAHFHAIFVLAIDNKMNVSEGVAIVR